MLNTAPIAAAAPLPGLVSPQVQTPPQGDGGPPFATALDQAAAHQRAASVDAEADSGAQAEAAADGTTAAVPGHARPKPTTIAGSARHGAMRNAVARDLLSPPTEALHKTSAQAAAADDKRVPDDGPPTSELGGQALLDLAAWVSGLPLQRAPASDNAASATPKDNAAERGGKTLALCADASPQPAASVRDAILAIDAEPSKPGTAHLAAGLATPPGLDPTGEDRRAAVASATPAALAHLAAAGGELQSGAEGLHLALARLRQPVGHEGSSDIPAAAAPPSASAWPLAGPRAHETASPFQTELKAALGTSEFASNLGSQLSVLVRDGIEHAQLKLNPAEMGPIEVRIRLDGTQAQVDFSAAHALTRQALQDAVPALASALLDNGLTLTGGGVFEQPREPRGEARRDLPNGSTATGTTTREGAGPDTSLPRQPRARGVVDLYA
jgi:flagellar hook-length control protein FliK